MSTERWEHIKRVFNAAMERPAAERTAFVEQTCGDDAELKREVLSLIQAARPTLEGGPVRTAGAVNAFANASPSAFTAVQLTERAGSVVGHYKLLQSIGEGGFGTVFLADQTAPVRRRVALKIIKLGMDTRSVVARFEAERQALALMDHPNIARVFDAGSTDSGRPYFVMEYVKGDPITLFADAHTLTLRERLELLTQVCHAVQHAHQKGVIHRDIKPSNVLVSMVDGKPLAKVIDFGIAKATGAAGGTLTDKTLFTEHRALIGTPEYMSPEQAEGSPDIDTRTDVYGLGVLMYELLTGTTPFEPSRLRSAAYAEMQRIIKEEEPPSPSLRISRDLQRDLKQLASTAAHRKVEPQRLNTLMRGELDWIVMKALDKDRARRFATPQDLAADIDRHLRGEAVVAAPASAAYRVRKFVRRNSGAVGAVSAVVLALSAGLSVAAWQWRVANSAIVSRDSRDKDIDRALTRVEQRLIGNTPEARLGWITKLAPDGSLQFGVEVVTTPMDHEANIARPASSDQGDDRLQMLAVLAADSIDTLKEERDLVSQSVNRLLASTVAQGLPVGIMGQDSPTMEVTSADGNGQERRFTFIRGTSADKWRVVGRNAQRQEVPLNTADSIEAIEFLSANTMNSLKIATDTAEWSAYTANLALAQAAMDAGDFPEARKRLADAPVSKRGWEFTLANTRASACVRSITTGNGVNPSSGYGLASPDGSIIVVWDDSNSNSNADLRDAHTGSVLAQLSWNGERVVTAAFSPDSRRVAIGSFDRAVRVWDTSTGKLVYTIDTTTNGVSSIQFSPDGKRIVIGGSYSRSAMIHDTESGALMNTIEGVRDRDSYIAINHDATLLVAASEDNLAHVWDTRNGTRLATLNSPGTVITRALFSPDGRRVVTGSSDSVARVWDARSGQLLKELRGHKSAIRSISFSSDGRKIATGSLDGTGIVWDATSYTLVATLGCHRSGIEQVVFSPDSTQVATASYDNTARVFTTEGVLLAECRGHQMAVRSVSFSADQKHLLTDSADNSVRVWAIDNDRSLAATSGPDQPLGYMIYSMAGSQRVDSLNQSLELSAILASSPNGPSGLTITTPDGARRIVGGSDKTVRFYEAQPAQTPAASTASPNAPAAAPASEAPPRELAVFRIPEAVTNLQMTADGTRLIISLAGGSARIWDIREPEERRKDMQAKWAERVPAGQYLDSQWSTQVPTPKLRESIIADATLTPLRRLVAVEMLDERITETNSTADNALYDLTKDATPTTDPTTIQAAAAATDLPPRVKEKLLSLLANWQPPAAMSEEERKLAEATAKLQAAESDATKQRELAADAAAFGACATYDTSLGLATISRPLTPAALRYMSKQLKVATVVFLQEAEGVDQSLKLLADPRANLNFLTSIDLSGTQLTAAGLRELARADTGLKTLHSLKLLATNTTDAELRDFAGADTGLKTLRSLDLMSTKVTDAGLESIARSNTGLSSLESLFISGENMTDAGIEALAREESGLRRLTTLSLWNTRLTDEGLKMISRTNTGLKALSSLDIGSTAVTDAGLKELTRSNTGLNTLTSLGLYGTKITDSGLRDLARADTGVPNLTSLNLFQTTVSNEGLSAVRARFPGITIER
jgi:WD40 repeat protein/serine/threonine protein kinase